MTTPPKTPAVTQEDRNSAVRLLEAGGQDWQAKEIRLKVGDHFPIVQAFANHRIASVEAATTIKEPDVEGSFVGDIWYGHPAQRTLGTHRWTGLVWEALPSELDVTLKLLADARCERDQLRAKLDEAFDLLTRAAGDITALLIMSGKQEKIAGYTALYISAINDYDKHVESSKTPAPLTEGTQYHILKGGYYYRPDAQGYTANKSEAGLYSLEEAISYSHPNGPNGPRDGITYELARKPCEWTDTLKETGGNIKVGGWQPIETAPKDGWHSPIITCRMGDAPSHFGHELVGGYAEPPEVAYWNEYGDCWTPCQRPHDPWHPTHWIPLLTPPAQEGV